MILVADSSALIALSACNSLGLLEQLFGSVVVPETVYLETTRPNKKEAQALKIFLQGKVRQVDLQGYVFLDALLLVPWVFFWQPRKTAWSVRFLHYCGKFKNPIFI